MENIVKKILIVIEGGIVQEVRTNDTPNVALDVVVRDFDNINAGDEDPLEGMTKEEIIQEYPCDNGFF